MTKGRPPVKVGGFGREVLARAGANEGNGGGMVGGQAQRGHEGHHAQRAGSAAGCQRTDQAVQRRRLHEAVRARHLLYKIQRLVQPACREYLRPVIGSASAQEYQHTCSPLHIQELVLSSEQTGTLEG